MLTANPKSDAYSQVIICKWKGVRTINIRVAERNRRVDIIQQLGLDAISVNQTLPESFQTPARHLARGGRNDFFTIAISGTFFVGVVGVWLEHVDPEVGLRDRNGSVGGARGFRGIDSFYGGFEFWDRLPALDDGRGTYDGTEGCGNKLVSGLSDDIESGCCGSGEAYFDFLVRPRSVLKRASALPNLGDHQLTVYRSGGWNVIGGFFHHLPYSVRGCGGEGGWMRLRS